MGAGGYRAALKKLFAVDPRALACLRVGLGSLIVLDLIARLGSVDPLYIDAGVLPRWEVLPVPLPGPAFWAGSAGFEQGLFGLIGLAAVLLILGVGSRAAAAACWLGLLSIGDRNPGAGNAGDLILVQLLFWSAFLPLGARWALRPGAPTVLRGERVLSVASVGLVLTMPLIYFTSVFHKVAGVGWLEGTVVFYTVSREMWSTPFGLFLAEQLPWTLPLLTWGTLVLECVGPLLLFSPFATDRLRLFAIASFVGLQAGLALSIELWLFPFISTLALVPLLPGAVFDRLGPAEGEGGGFVDGLPAARWLRGLGVAVPAFALLCTAGAHLHTFTRLGSAPPDFLARTAGHLGLQQAWIMYSSERPWDGRLLVRGEAEDGTRFWIDDQDEHASWAPVRELRESYRGRRYLVRLEYRARESELAAFAAWVCARHDAQPAKVGLVRWRRSIELDDTTPTVTRKLFDDYACRPR
jgi:hypothetical protein